MIEPTNEQMEAAVRVMQDGGENISCPWDGTLDDLELHRFETLKSAIAAAMAITRDDANE